MTEHLFPEADAKARIQALPRQQLQSFFDELPMAGMQRVARILPAIHGFRTTSPAGIARQKEALARRLNQANATDRDYHALYFVWREWIDAKFLNAALVQEHIDEMEQVVDRADGVEARRLAIEEQVIFFVEKLKEESHQNQCTREQIERAFTFSPFPELPATRDIIAKAKSAADVERDATLHELPHRLREDENEIKSIKTQLKTLEERIELLAAIQVELPQLKSAIEAVNAGVEDTRKGALRQSRAAATEVIASYDERLNAVEGNIQVLKEAADSLQSDLRSILSKLPAFSVLQETVAQVVTATNHAAEGDQQQAQRIAQIAQIATELEQARSDVLECLEGWRPLTERVAELERRISTHPDHAPLPYQLTDHANRLGALLQGPRSCLYLDKLQVSGHGATATIQSHADLIAALAKPLESMGLRKSAARIFAEECAAAVVGRQVIFLEGGLATPVARALALAVGGPESARVSIPIGLQDGEELRFALEQMAPADKTTLTAITIEGINRTALDIVGEVLADCVSGYSSRAVQPRKIVFATVLRGAASLPVDPSYFELGPLFDLDYLDWRSSPSPNSQSFVGILPTDVDSTSHAQAMGTGVNVDECIRLARCFGRKRNPSLERIVVSAYRALHLTRSDQNTITPIQSLFYGWLLPHWRALELSKVQVDDELDGGRVQGSAVDARLAAMLEAEFAESTGQER